MPGQYSVSDIETPPSGTGKYSSADIQVEPPPDTDTWGNALREFGHKINPIPMAQGLADTIMHPGPAIQAYGQQNEQIFNRAKDAYQKGNYSEAAAHGLNYLLNGIPGVGAALDEAGNKMANGKVKEGLADTAALATQIVAGAKAPKLMGAMAEPGAFQPAINVVNATAAGVKAAAPDVAAGTAKVGMGAALGEVLPGPTKYAASYPVYRGVRQVSKGLATGAQAFKEALNGGASDVDAMAAAQDAALYEDIAHGQYGGSYKGLAPEKQAAIRDLAEKIKGSTSAPPAESAPLTPRSPEEILGSPLTEPASSSVSRPPVAPGTTVQDILAQEMAARKAQSSPAPSVPVASESIPVSKPVGVLNPSGVNVPLRPPLATTTSTPVETPSTQVVAAPTGKPTPAEIAQQLKDEMVKNGYLSPESAAEPESAWPAREVFAESRRPFKAMELAQPLHETGITAEDLEKLDGVPSPELKAAVKALGINQDGDISSTSLQMTIDQLRKLEAAKPKPKLVGKKSISDMMK